MSGSGFSNDIMHAENVDFTGNFPVTPQMTADGQLLIGAGLAPFLRANTLTAGTGITITNGPGTISIASNGANDLHTARFIVSALGTIGTGANYGTISAAITAAQATGTAQTIVIMPGTYSENVTINSGTLNIVAFTGDSDLPSVILHGRIFVAGTSVVNVSNIRFTSTGSIPSLQLTDSSDVEANGCYFDMGFPGNNVISKTGGTLTLSNCTGDTSVSNSGLLTNITSGEVNIIDCVFYNTLLSTVANASTHGTLNITNSTFYSPFSIQTDCAVNMWYSNVLTSSINTASITSTSSSGIVLKQCNFTSGTASSISVSNNLTMVQCDVNSSNTNAITGAGTIQYAGLTFSGSSSTINTTTQTPLITGPLTKTKAFAVNYVSTAISYQVLVSDEIIGVTDNSAARTITMPNAGLTTGQIWTVKDQAGTAGSANAIIISGNGVNIDGAATFQIASNYGAVNLYYNGTQFYVF